MTNKTTKAKKSTKVANAVLAEETKAQPKTFTAADLKTFKALPMKHIRAELGASARGNRNIIYSGVAKLNADNTVGEYSAIDAIAIPADLAKEMAETFSKRDDVLHSRTFYKKPNANGEKMAGVWIAFLKGNEDRVQHILNGLNKVTA